MIYMYSEEMVTPVEYFSSVDTSNFTNLSDTNEHETACNDFENSATSGIQENADIPPHNCQWSVWWDSVKQWYM